MKILLVSVNCARRVVKLLSTAVIRLPFSFNLFTLVKVYLKAFRKSLEKKNSKDLLGYINSVVS